jgi:hypothetical protein
VGKGHSSGVLIMSEREFRGHAASGGIAAFSAGGKFPLSRPSLLFSAGDLDGFGMPALIGSQLSLNLWQLVLIFMLRTLVTLPVVAVIAHFMVF